MVDMFSNYTAAIVGMLMAFAFKDLAWGVLFGTGITVIWGQIFGVSLEVTNFLGIWFWSILVYSIVGFELSWLLNTIPKLDPRWGKQNTVPHDKSPLRIAIKYLVFILLVAGVHVLFEVRFAEDVVEGVLDFVAALMLIIPYGALYFMFRGEYVYYGKFKDKQMSDKEVQHHVRDFVFWLFIIHFATAIVYASVDLAVDDPENYWNLFSLLIVALAAMIAMFVVIHDRCCGSSYSPILEPEGTGE